MLMSDADAATAQWIISVPPDVCNDALATGEALPVAFVSDVIAFAVATPLDDAPNAVVLSGNVATAVPGDPMVPDSLNTRLPDAPMRAVTASVAAFCADVLWVTDIVVFLC